MFDTIHYEVTGGVAVITLNRPEVMNAISTQLGRELYDALKQAENEKSVRAVILTGAGKGFCSGQDLGDAQARELKNLADAVRERYNVIVAKMQAMPIPIIAAVNGACAGAGFGLALACDLRFASTQAKFTMAFSKIGLVPDSGSSYFLSRLVGVGRALELSWTGDVISAETAHQYGIVNKVFAPESLLAETMAYAQRLAVGPTLALGLTKQAVYENFSATLPEALEREAQLQQIAGASRDFHEGVTAFLEKRLPNYEGR